ncbi:MAG: tRNA (guanosine(37)-N1)-methyltransferase TrmD [Planctomycetota bacterium]|jgi:tRNA (guanine37-N1)-methyltransferase|nr:tRNA (guanosine(37)-N1)-methyltransferase TrmD [Planctomycetota bacterium]
MRIDFMTLFPGLFSGFVSESIPRIAQDKGVVSLQVHDIRAWSTDRHGKVDDRPFGGGPGMVLACQPLWDAITAVRSRGASPGRLIFLTPEGKRFNQAYARELAGEERLVLVAGRYEGFDERVFEILQPERLSLGDFILSGGELAAMVVAEAVIRLLPGVLGSPESAGEDSFSLESPLLDHPHYTQPPQFMGLEVPEVLRSGNHAKIKSWRQQQAREKTRHFRPDLLKEGEGEEHGSARPGPEGAG